MNQLGEQITTRNGTESSLMTLADALREAMDFERSSVRIYSHLADKVDSQVRSSILQLVSEAKIHMKLVEAAAQKPESILRLTQSSIIRLSAVMMRHSISLPDLGGDVLEDDALNYVQVRERLACDFYTCLLRSTPDGPLHDLIVRLQEAKRRHDEEVEACCAALFVIF